MLHSSSTNNYSTHNVSQPVSTFEPNADKLDNYGNTIKFTQESGAEQVENGNIAYQSQDEQDETDSSISVQTIDLKLEWMKVREEKRVIEEDKLMLQKQRKLLEQQQMELEQKKLKLVLVSLTAWFLDLGSGSFSFSRINAEEPVLKVTNLTQRVSFENHLYKI